ncbi:thioredoxin family protein [Enterococcus sp. CWB-B31]|uniref:thioredoxin family protein n=1 Tax=Enterococcus sp. CWB-B31 TaxID=2885159 RepID=UPI001E411AA4|nr:thioredoxin family protein [Enterococcus sp. CWB-B31]MCB5954887.1 thioredoxin family protein [Enterococcus sp. CWB-B31]
MKKKLMIAAILTGIFTINLLTANHAYSLSNEVEVKEAELIESKGAYPEIYDAINAITVPTFKQKLVREESFYLYVGRPTCGDCNDFEPALIDLINEYELGDKLLYLNVAKLRMDEPAWEEFKGTYNLIYTPTLAKFEGGKLISKVEWTPEDGISADVVETWINNHVANGKNEGTNR